MAIYIAWREEYSVGDPSLDAEHQQIIDSINDLYAAMNGPADGVAKKCALDKLGRYTRDHFDHEEKVLRSVGYPDFAAHKALHDDMRRRTLGLQSHLSLVTARDVILFLKDWWLNHIQAEDKKYAAYVEPATARG